MEESVSPIRQQINEIRGSKAYLDNMHPSHEAALQTISRLYAAEYPDEGSEAPEVVEGAIKEAQEVHEEALKVDDPEAAAVQEALKPLKEEWASNYDANVQAAQGLVAKMTAEMGVDVAEVFDNIGNSPRVIRALFDWSEGRDGGALTSDDANEIIGLIQKSEVYQRGISQTSEVLRNVMQVLYEAAYK